MSAKRFPDTTATRYTYTPTGRMQTVADVRGTTSYTYDVRERLTTRTDPDGRGISYGYDAANNRTAVTTASGTTTYTFDKYNELETVTDPSGGLTRYTYDKAGNLTKTAFANGTAETRQYDTLNRLLYLENTNASGVISSYRYTLDASGNRRKVEENTGRIVEYDYDALYRLLQEQVTDATNGNRRTNYVYDPIGNRLSQTDATNGQSTTYGYDANDRLLNESMNGQVKATYTYDHNGNTLTKVQGTDQTVYDWDYENRLIGAQVTTGTGMSQTQYQYNAEGIRVGATTDGVETRYLIDGNRSYAQVLEEYAPNGTVGVSYVYGHDLISQERGGVESFYLVDGLGSTRVLTNAAGNVTDTATYDAYGNVAQKTGMTQNAYGFAGEQFDGNVGQYYLRARYYDAGVGRFAGRDPFEGDMMQPLSLAKYPYVHGNPVNATDPSGKVVIFEVFTEWLGSTLRAMELPTYIGLKALAQGVAFLIPTKTALLGLMFLGYLDSVLQGYSDAYDDSREAVLIFRRNYNDLREANWKFSDKYFHCKANCEAAQLGETGYLTSEWLSDIREGMDMALKGDSEQDATADQKANDLGREGGRSQPYSSPKVICQSLRPKGLPKKY